MKAIILAAGRGVRMGSYTDIFPKGMLLFNGKTLIELQLEIIRDTSINRIIIVTGYKPETIGYEGITYYHNPDYRTTNMVVSLMCARPEMDEDIIVSYADIIYTKNIMKKMIKCEWDVAVAVDPAWREYWKRRYGTTERDLESLAISNGTITELGEPRTSSENISYRYVGLIKFSKNVLGDILSIYDLKKKKKGKWVKSGNRFSNGYMTDLLNEVIMHGIDVHPVMADKQWLEIDTPSDYKNILSDLQDGSISDYFRGLNT